MTTAASTGPPSCASARRLQLAQDLGGHLDRRQVARARRQPHHARRVDEAVGEAAIVGEVGEAATHHALDRHDACSADRRSAARPRRARRSRRPRRSGRSTGPACGPRRRAARPRGRRRAPSRRASSSCRGRCRSPGAARAARAPRPARRSASAPSCAPPRRGSHPSTSAAIASTSLASLARNASSRTSGFARAASRSAIDRRASRARLERAGLGAHLRHAARSSAARSPCAAAAASGFAPLELPLEEVERERRVGLGERVDAGEREQVARALDRIGERAVGLVHARGRLQRETLRDASSAARVAVRVHAPLQRRGTRRRALPRRSR